MSERWIVSDWHLDHDNIIKYCNRPFANGKEMTEALITFHNELVKPQDRVYNLGDVTMHRGKKWVEWLNIIQKFNGHLILFPGNHDHFEAQEYLNAGFEDIRATWRDDLNIVYSHFPIHPESMGSAVANVHGHTHDAPDEAPVIERKGDKVPAFSRGAGDAETVIKKVIRPYINVSVERTNYRPIHIDELLQRIEKAKETR
jgi:calcineurin-like phosphoesterase family protein